PREGGASSSPAAPRPLDWRDRLAAAGCLTAALLVLGVFVFYARTSEDALRESTALDAPFEAIHGVYRLERLERGCEDLRAVPVRTLSETSYWTVKTVPGVDLSGEEELRVRSISGTPHPTLGEALRDLTRPGTSHAIGGGAAVEWTVDERALTTRGDLRESLRGLLTGDFWVTTPKVGHLVAREQTTTEAGERCVTVRVDTEVRLAPGRIRIERTVRSSGVRTSCGAGTPLACRLRAAFDLRRVEPAE
ncbi:MAG TPA: hypothetical protein RMH99_30900, partial [Sandaracinaceae bacterium LLY-WYZ-13_1]|nr:hypothetical protein [Sandaracinaceae bacterium LLY-WYZ-13_1]